MSIADPGQEPAASVPSGRGQRWVASRSRCAVLVLGVASAFRFVLGETWETLHPRAPPPEQPAGLACCGAPAPRPAGLRLHVLRGSGSASCGVRCRVAGPFAVLRRSSPELPFPSLWCGGGGSGNAALRSEGGCESGDAGPPSFSAVGGKDGDTGPAGMRGPGSAGVYAAGGSSRHCPGRGRHLLTAAVAARACLPRCASDMQLPRGLCRSAPVWQCVGDESPARTNETGNNESHL